MVSWLIANTSQATVYSISAVKHFLYLLTRTSSDFRLQSYQRTCSPYFVYLADAVIQYKGQQMDLFQFLSYQTNLYKIDFYKWLCLYLDIIENEGQLNDFPGLNKGLNEWIITSNVKGFKYWMKQTFMLPSLCTPFFFTLIYSGVFHREQSSLFQERPDHSHTATHSHLEVAYHEHNLICHWAATLEPCLRAPQWW